MITDTLRQFVLDSCNVRGSCANLTQSWQTILERADYPATIQSLLGEALAAISLLSTTVKHKGSLILQIRGNGAMHLLVAQINHQGQLRGLARWSKEPSPQDSLQTIFGDGHFAITLESDNENERYQGIIALEGDTIAQTLERYFIQSEQLPTRIHLTADQHQASGILIQRLPKQSSQEDWERATLLFSTLTTDELRQLTAESMVYRLFHEETPRIFTPKPLTFACSCGQDRVEQMLISLGRKEAYDIIAEHGEIAITCEFCNAHYTLNATDVERLFVAQKILPNTPH